MQVLYSQILGIKIPPSLGAHDSPNNFRYIVMFFILRSYNDNKAKEETEKNSSSGLMKVIA
jgi:hypothetical protein